MRNIPADLTASLNSEAQTLATVWRFERKDGLVFAFSDHDEPIALGAVTAVPQLGLRAGEIETSSSLAPDTASVTGALDTDAITDADLVAGLWDEAKVEILRLDWRAPGQSVSLFSGRLGQVHRGEQAFEAELRGIQAALQTRVGRSFSTACDAALGDARCQVNLATATFTFAGQIAAIENAFTLRISGVAAAPTGWFVYGTCLLPNNRPIRVIAHRLVGTEALITLEEAPAVQPSLGSSLSLIAGCDKQGQTCRQKFANMINFQGFPAMPGNDLLTAGPNSTVPMDGASRVPTSP
jgi:uncharacterized phage protein (TIGR02218 family)